MNKTTKIKAFGMIFYKIGHFNYLSQEYTEMEVAGVHHMKPMFLVES